MKKTILKEIANNIESLSLFSGAGVNLQEKIDFYGGFIGVIADNKDLTAMIESEDEVACKSLSESLSEMETLVGPGARVNLFDLPIPFQEKGSYAARIVTARTMFKKCELDLLCIHQDVRINGFSANNQAMVDESVTLEKLDLKENLTQNLQPRSNTKSESDAQQQALDRAVRKIDAKTGKTGPNSDTRNLGEHSQGSDTRSSTEKESSVVTVFNAVHQRSTGVDQEALTGQDCLDILDAAQQGLREIKADGLIDKTAGVTDSNKNALEELRKKFSARASEEGGNYIRNMNGN